MLAAVSGDPALAGATADDDLYAPVAARLGVERPIAKVAVLAAMYGQTSGAAGEALRGLERAYPVAMGYLRAAHDAGAAGGDVRRTADGGSGCGRCPNRSIPGAAAAARAVRPQRASCRVPPPSCSRCGPSRCAPALPPGAEIVLCLHDELLVQAREDDGDRVAALLTEVLATTAARWASGSGVRFVADVSVLRRWSDAKG